MKSKNNKEEQSRRISSPSSSLYIVIHVSEITFDSCKGPATTPVKVYADKFMIQMEDSSTKKEIGFRVPCKNILSLDVSIKHLLEHFFMFKFIFHTMLRNLSTSL